MARPKFVTMDDSKLKEFKGMLEDIAAEALPFAMRDTLNGAAFRTQKLARANIENEFTLRNKFTARRVLVDKIQSTRTFDMESGAAVGHTEEYMALQEFGGVLTPRGIEGYPVPTAVASDEPRGTRPRRKPRAGPRRLRRVKVMPTVKGKNRAQTNALTVRAAAKRRRRHVKLRTERGIGIYRLKNLGDPEDAQPELMYSLERRTRRIKPTPWLQPATDLIVPRMFGIYRKELLRQLRRRRIGARL